MRLPIGTELRKSLRKVRHTSFVGLKGLTMWTIGHKFASWIADIMLAVDCVSRDLGDQADYPKGCPMISLTSHAWRVMAVAGGAIAQIQATLKKLKESK